MKFLAVLFVAMMGCDDTNSLQGSHYVRGDDCTAFAVMVCDRLEEVIDECRVTVRAGFDFVDDSDRVRMLGGCHRPPRMSECWVAIEHGDIDDIMKHCSIAWDVI